MITDMCRVMQANTNFFVSAWKMETPNLSNESYLVERTHVGNLQ